MKSQLQVLTFLNQYVPATELDRDMITAFLEKRYRITPTTSIFALESIFSPLDAQSFLQWYENGFTGLEMAKFDDSLVLLGNCTLDEAEIIAIFESGSVTVSERRVPTSQLSKISADDVLVFQRAMTDANLQPNPTTLTTEPKYIPTANEKVRFHSYDSSIRGIGVVREVNIEKHSVELYCYFIYPVRGNNGGTLGYSMHERNVVNLDEYIFEPLLEERETNISCDDDISAYRRMKRELEKAGKVWHDKIHRIEPVNYRREKGDKYWYISDKMIVVEEKEKGTPTSQMRYLCGNYFTDHGEALKTLNAISDLIRNYLASEKWPIFDNN